MKRDQSENFPAFGLLLKEVDKILLIFQEEGHILKINPFFFLFKLVYFS